MATPPPIPNCAQVRLLWSDPIRTFMNVTHAQVTTAGPLNPNVAETIFTALKADARVTAWLARLPTTTHFTGVDVRDLRASNNPLLSSSSAAVPGTAAVPALPPQTSMVVTLRTAFAGRAFRGRVYLGGISQDTQDINGQITAAANLDGVQFVNALFSEYPTALGPLAIAQRFLPERPGHGGVTLPERPAGVVVVTAVLARDTIFDTQRRRSGAHIGSR